ncbi:DegV family protein [Fusibacter sp. JL298sf-3]
METVLNGKDFYNFFKSGAHEVSSKKEALNAINVFPVQDGDTGTNLVMTLHAIVDETTLHEDFNLVVQSMSDIALESAKGNSGLIFASFINGFYSACDNLKVVTMAEFGTGAYKAAEEAYSAVSEPVEGTMLTVMKAWSGYLFEHHAQHLSFKELLKAAYKKALSALEETPEKLEVLRRNKVVDAGAKGFVLFLEGVNRVFSDFKEAVVDAQSAAPIVEMQVHNQTETALTYRYCTEFILRCGAEEKGVIKAIAEKSADSVVVSGNARIVKVHLHTEHPEKVAEELVQRGYVIGKAKVDDMRVQRAVTEHPKSKVGILTDSIADIPDDILLKEQIHMLPLSIVADGNTYLDKMTLTAGQMQRLMDESAVYPSTSQPDVKGIQSKLDWMLAHYEEVVVISVSQALSGTYSQFQKAIGERTDVVHLVDSKLNTAGQGLAVLQAATLANAGASAEAIVSEVTSLVARTKVFVSLDTFKYAVKSGRVPNVIGRFLTACGAKPIMSLKPSGEGTAFGLALSRRGIDRQIERLVRTIRDKRGISRYAVVHAGNEKLAERYAERFTQLIGTPPAYLMAISSVTAIHAGVGAVAIALIEEVPND